LLRFDMDGLPIEEESDLPFRSTNQGAMHACGHDGHIAIGITCIKILDQLRDQFNGKVIFLFQPAEEGLGGAARMIRDGVLDNGIPDFCLASHIWAEKPRGWLACTPGALMAGSGVFHIHLTGRGGHGAIPDQTSDPVITACQLVNALQTIVSRNVSPLDSTVLSVTQIKAGEVLNVVPTTADIHGIVRAFRDELLELMFRRIREIASGVASGMGCQAEVTTKGVTPPVVNNEKITKVAASILNKILPDSIIINDYRTMVSEDMALFLQIIPGCYFLVGALVNQIGGNYGHHNPRFNFDEEALPIAVSVMAGTTLGLLDHFGRKYDKPGRNE
jgi:amidohydrolase